MPYQPTLASIEFLISLEGRRWLAEVATWDLSEANELRNLMRLRRDLPSDLAAAVLEQVWLRRRAVGRFPQADEMLFTRAGLEQATAVEVANHRAMRLVGSAGQRVADLGSGVGGDSLAMARHGLRVLALDRDAILVHLLSYNAQVLSLSDRILPVQGNSVNPPFSPPEGNPFAVDARCLDAVFADPSRRTAAGDRVFRAESYSPPLSELIQRFGTYRLVVKIGPGLDFDALDWPGEVEITSLAGEVKEAVLWGTAFSTPGLTRRATLLPGGEQLTDLDPGPPPEVGSPGAFLVEPDGAVIRAGLVAQLAARIGSRQIDRQIAYLTSDTPVQTPFGRTYRIDEVMPFNLKALNGRLRALEVGTVVVKKRGLPIDPDDFRRRLKANGPHARVIFLTRVADAPTILIGRQGER